MGASMPPKDFSTPNALRPYQSGTPLVAPAQPLPANALTQRQDNITPLTPAQQAATLIPTVTPPQNGVNGTYQNPAQRFANGGGANNGYGGVRSGRGVGYGGRSSVSRQDVF